MSTDEHTTERRRSSAGSPQQRSGRGEKFPKYGVKLSFFEEFIDRCGGRQAIASLTTTEVCERFVVPFTRDDHCSICQLLIRQESTQVGDANVFISHAWKYRFLDVVDALSFHFCLEADTCVVWFDLFSNNHNEAFELDYEWWHDTFMSAITKMARCVMVFAPWQDPVPLTRAWCLFELYSAFVTGAKFEIAMSSSEKSGFIKTMMNDFGAMNKVYARIDVRKSTSTLPLDQERIFELVQRTVGFDALNALVCKKLREWVIDVAEQQLQVLLEAEAAAAAAAARGASSGGGVSVNKLKAGLANLHFTQGSYVRARDLFRQCYHARLARSGETDRDTLWAMYSLANAHWALRDADAAMLLHRQCLDLRRAVLGPQHRDTLWSMNNLANVLTGTGRYAEARQLYEECLEGRKRVFGPEHRDTVASLSNLAQVCTLLYEKDGDEALLERARDMHDYCLQFRRRALGERNPVTLWSVYNVAHVLHLQRRYVEAARVHGDCLSMRRSLLGKRNPDTLASTQALAKVYFALAQSLRATQPPDAVDYAAKAFELMDGYLARAQRVFGPRHQHCVDAVDVLLSVCDEHRDVFAERKRRLLLAQLSDALGDDAALLSESMRSLSLSTAAWTRSSSVAADGHDEAVDGAPAAAASPSRATFQRATTDATVSVEDAAVSVPEAAQEAKYWRHLPSWMQHLAALLADVCAAGGGDALGAGATLTAAEAVERMEAWAALSEEAQTAGLRLRWTRALSSHPQHFLLHVARSSAEKSCGAACAACSRPWPAGAGVEESHVFVCFPCSFAVCPDCAEPASS